MPSTAPADIPEPRPLDPALEAILATTAADARRRTDDVTMLAAVTNLAADCRAIAGGGDLDAALSLARHLARSVPEYLIYRGYT